MSTILILDDRRSAGQLYTVGLEAYVGATVVELQCHDAAADYLTSNAPKIAIVHSSEEKDVGIKMTQIVSQNKLGTSLIVIGKTKSSTQDVAVYEESVTLQEIIRKCAQILGVTAKSMAERDVGKYYPIKLSMLSPGLKLVAPIFRAKANEVYTKFLDRDNCVHPEILSILSNEGEEYIYVESSERLKFVNSLTVRLSELLASENLTLEQKVQYSGQAFKVIQDAARKMAISPEIIQMTEANIKVMTAIVSKIPKLREMLKVTDKDLSLGYRHSLLICFVAGHIISKMEWGTQEQRMKVAFVSFFHDIAITDEELLLIHSDEELDAADINQEQRVMVQRHAINAAQILNKFYASLPFGVETIVKQHHGTRDGIGFNSYPNSVSPLALVFMVAEEWVHHILIAEKTREVLQKVEVLDKLRAKYKSTAFQNIIKAIEDLAV